MTSLPPRLLSGSLPVGDFQSWLAARPLNSLAARLRAAERTVDRRAGEARSIGMRGKELTQRAAVLREQIAQLDRVTGVLTSLGDVRQEEAQSTLEAIV